MTIQKKINFNINSHKFIEDKLNLNNDQPKDFNYSKLKSKTNEMQDFNDDVVDALSNKDQIMNCAMHNTEENPNKNLLANLLIFRKKISRVIKIIFK